MKKTFIIYGSFLIALLILGVIAIQVSQISGISSSLRMLGKNEKDFLEARRQLLLCSTNPGPALASFAQNKKNSERARLHALHILEELALQQNMDTIAIEISSLVESASDSIRMAALKVLMNAQSLVSLGPVIEIFKTSHDTAFFQQSFRTLKEATKPLYNATRARISERDSAGLDSCLSILDTLPVGGGELFRFLPTYFRQRGDFSRASEFYQRAGVIRNWWLTGGWENQKMAAFYKELPPEIRPFSPHDKFILSDTLTVGWHKIQHQSSDRALYINNALAKKFYSIAYFFTYIHSPTPRDAILFFGSDDGIRVWVNDSLVFSHKVFRGAFIDNDAVKIHLKKGKNKLLVKLAQDIGGWALIARLTGVDGKGMNDVVISLTDSIESGIEGTIKTILAADDSQWKRLVKDIDENDNKAAYAIVDIISDEASDIKTRLNALKALEMLNSKRQFPAGHRELMDMGNRLLQKNITDELACSILKALSSMNTGKGLDLGLLAQKSNNPDIRYYGNRLISLYCRTRIIELGDVKNSEKQMANSRIMNDLISLKPSDPWVIERLAAFFCHQGDTTKCTKLASQLAMPEKWLLWNNASEKSQFDFPIRTDNAGNGEAWWEQAKSPWRKIKVATDALHNFGTFLDFTFQTAPRRGKGISVFRSAVFSDRTAKVYLTCTFPAPFRIRLNGKVVGNHQTENPKDYHLYGIYNYQQRNFDASSYPVQLNKGMNDIVVIVGNEWFVTWGGYTPFLRCGIVDSTGCTLGFDRNTINWQDTQ